VRVLREAVGRTAEFVLRSLPKWALSRCLRSLECRRSRAVRVGFAGVNLGETPGPARSSRLAYVGTWLSLVEHSLGVRGVGSSNLPVPTIARQSGSFAQAQDFACGLPLALTPAKRLKFKSARPDHCKAIRILRSSSGFRPRAPACAHARKTAQVQICPSRPLHAAGRCMRAALLFVGRPGRSSGL
jgi:hypothetical protein